MNLRLLSYICFVMMISSRLLLSQEESTLKDCTLDRKTSSPKLFEHDDQDEDYVQNLLITEKAVKIFLELQDQDLEHIIHDEIINEDYFYVESDRNSFDHVDIFDLDKAYIMLGIDRIDE